MLIFGKTHEFQKNFTMFGGWLNILQQITTAGRTCCRQERETERRSRLRDLVGAQSADNSLSPFKPKSGTDVTWRGPPHPTPSLTLSLSLVKTPSVTEFCATCIMVLQRNFRIEEDSCIHMAVKTYILYTNRNTFEMIVEKRY